MSIYIPGVDLPPNNQELWIAIRHDGTFKFNSVGWHGSQQKAIAVQSHGRLGDLDALVDWLKLSYGTSIPLVRGLLFSSIIKEIQEYPSVIPAEQRGKEV